MQMGYHRKDKAYDSQIFSTANWNSVAWILQVAMECINAVAKIQNADTRLTWFLSSSQFLYSCSPSFWKVTITKPTKMLTMKNAMTMM